MELPGLTFDQAGTPEPERVARRMNIQVRYCSSTGYGSSIYSFPFQLNKFMNESLFLGS